MNIINWNKINEDAKQKILNRTIANNNNIQKNVAEIIAKVRKDGDDALLYYAELFDGVKLDTIKISVNDSDTKIKDAINNAYERIWAFHELQVPKNITLDEFEIKAWKSWLPIENVGLYIPGGTAPLVSTLLMLAIPAKLAGCKQIVCVTPPNNKGQADSSICYAAELCGLDLVFASGGAQAIAALAYGSESIPKVDKIFGPGNKFVTEAKIQVAKDPLGAAIDMPAGPSEVMVIADENANPNIVASDLLAQAEHDNDAVAICITTSYQLADEINNILDKQLELLMRAEIIKNSLKRSAILIVEDLAEAFDIANKYAPEHLILNIDNAKDYVGYVKNAGSVFLGKWSAEALGDYASGPNHVLPTYGYAKNYSGLGVESFMKAITFQEVSPQGLLQLAPTVEALANFEGLDAHKKSVSMRRLLLEKK